MKIIQISIMVICLVLGFAGDTFAGDLVEVRQKFYSLPGDGYIDARGYDWNALHQAIPVRALYDRFYSYGALARLNPENDYALFRGYFPFDTSSLPAECNVTSAVLKLYIQPEPDAIRDGFPAERITYFTLVESRQQSPSILDVSDFQRIGDIEGGVRVPVTNLVLGQYNTFPLNSTGLNWISPGRYTYLCMRTNWDIDNIPPVDSGRTGSGFSIFVSEKDPDQQYDPYLEITYYCSEENIPPGAEILGYVEEAEIPFASGACSVQVSNIGVASFSDYNKNGKDEHFRLGTTEDGLPVVCVQDVSGHEITFFDANYLPTSFTPLVDDNGNLIVTVMAEEKDTGITAIQSRNAFTGELITAGGL